MISTPTPEAPAPVRPRRRPRERFAAGTLGALLVIGGFGPSAIIAVDPLVRHFMFALIACVSLGYGLFGLDLMVQALRGAPRKSGFFYRWLTRLSRVPPAALPIGLALLIGFAIAGCAAAGDEVGMRVALVFGVVWLAYIVNLSAHELGHLLAARLAGLSLVRVLIGPLDFIRTTDGWRLRPCKQWLLVTAGVVFVDTSRQPSPLQLVVLSAGGPAANLALLLLLLALNPYRYADLAETWYKPGPALVLFGALIALFLLVLSLRPAQTTRAGLPTDGFVILHNLARLRKAGAKSA
jgi:hypothetical protein